MSAKNMNGTKLLRRSPRGTTSTTPTTLPPPSARRSLFTTNAGTSIPSKERTITQTSLD
ncbi:hypothetical protein SOVF_215020, partial [Spinacia oleracea]